MTCSDVVAGGIERSLALASVVQRHPVITPRGCLGARSVRDHGQFTHTAFTPATSSAATRGPRVGGGRRCGQEQHQPGQAVAAIPGWPTFGPSGLTNNMFRKSISKDNQIGNKARPRAYKRGERKCCRKTRGIRDRIRTCCPRFSRRTGVTYETRYGVFVPCFRDGFVCVLLGDGGRAVARDATK